jgi:hypothetical protein
MKRFKLVLRLLRWVIQPERFDGLRPTSRAVTFIFSFT